MARSLYEIVQLGEASRRHQEALVASARARGSLRPCAACGKERWVDNACMHCHAEAVAEWVDGKLTMKEAACPSST